MSELRAGDANHPREALGDLLDGRLSAAEADAVRGHLAGCDACRSEMARLDEGRRAAQSARVSRPMPADLMDALRARLDTEDRGHQQLPTRRGVLIGGLAAAAALLIAVWWGRRPGSASSLPEAVAGDFRSIESGALPLERRTSSAAELEAFFTSSAAGRRPARVRVIDLAMMQFELDGGRRHTLAGRDSVLYTYHGAGGDRLVCQMFEGQLAELPATTDVRDGGAFRFHVFRSGELTSVFWQEGPIVCVLVSSRPTDEVVALARAKAML